jgi:hypothetical protein
MPTVDQLLNFSSLLTVNKWDSRLSIANAAADLAISGNMTFMQTQALATILGCHKRASAFGRAPEVEYNMIKLEQQIKLFFATEWETVLKGESIFNYTYNKRHTLEFIRFFSHCRQKKTSIFH